MEESIYGRGLVDVGGGMSDQADDTEPIRDIPEFKDREVTGEKRKALIRAWKRWKKEKDKGQT